MNPDLGTHLLVPQSSHFYMMVTRWLTLESSWQWLLCKQVQSVLRARVLFQEACVTGPVKSEARKATEVGAHCAHGPGAWDERRQCTPRTWLHSLLSHSQLLKVSGFRPGTFTAFLVALRATVPPSSGLFQAESSSRGKGSHRHLGRCLRTWTWLPQHRVPGTALPRTTLCSWDWLPSRETGPPPHL